MHVVAFVVVLGCASCALLGSWGYFRHYQISRPPIGVFTLTDIVIMLLMVILVPFLYLVFPLWLVVCLLGLAVVSILSATWQPVLRVRGTNWVVTLVLLAADLGAALFFGTASGGFFAINDAVLIVVVVGITNLWAQSGLKARDAALLGALLAVYDGIATTALPLMASLYTRLIGLPLVPTLAWGSSGMSLGIGLGDVLLATVFPLVMRKAFGLRAGIAALVLALCAMGALLALPLRGLFPAMVVLGPLMLLQYLWWRRFRAQERTMWQYLQQEPPGSRKVRQST